MHMALLQRGPTAQLPTSAASLSVSNSHLGTLAQLCPVNIGLSDLAGSGPWQGHPVVILAACYSLSGHDCHHAPIRFLSSIR